RARSHAPRLARAPQRRAAPRARSPARRRTGFALVCRLAPRGPSPHGTCVAWRVPNCGINRVEDLRARALLRRPAHGPAGQRAGRSRPTRVLRCENNNDQATLTRMPLKVLRSFVPSGLASFRLTEPRTPRSWHMGGACVDPCFWTEAE